MRTRVNQRAVVVFRSEVYVWWARFLKPGFKHCFVVLQDEEHWLMIEPLGRQLEIWKEARTLYDIAQDPLIYFLKQGYQAISVPVIDAPEKIAPMGIYTCVEVVKRVLGIHNRWIVTPWQLYKSLNRKLSQDTVLKQFISTCRINNFWTILKEQFRRLQ